MVLNYPKTGSTSVRTMLKKVAAIEHKKSLIKRTLRKFKIIPPVLQEFILPNIKTANRPPDQHGTIDQLPDKFKSYTKVSVVRNPFSRFLSLYEFKWWQKYLPIDEDLLKERFPSFPNLSLDEYAQMMVLHDLETMNGSNPLDLGVQTIQFIQMFFKDAVSILPKVTEEYFYSGQYKEDLEVVHFLRQEDLNNELWNFLEKNGFSARYKDIILNSKRENVTKSKLKNRTDLWTTSTIEYVKYRERFLFLILKDLGINYSEPTV